MAVNPPLLDNRWSSVLHGSAGGTIVTVRHGTSGKVVHRLEPALALCPLTPTCGA